MRRALRCAAGIVTAAGVLGLARPALAQPAAYRSPNRGASLSRMPFEVAAVRPDINLRLQEMRIELAWLADAAVFPYPLTAQVTGDKVEVLGTVPNDLVRQRALLIAREHTALKVLDSLQVKATWVSHMQQLKPELVQNAARELLTRSLGSSAQKIQVRVDPAGQVTLTGSVGSVEEQVAVSRLFRRLAGCVSVTNHLLIAPAMRDGQRVVLVTKDGRQAVSPLALNEEAPSIPPAPIVLQQPPPPAPPPVKQAVAVERSGVRVPRQYPPAFVSQPPPPVGPLPQQAVAAPPAPRKPQPMSGSLAAQSAELNLPTPLRLPAPPPVVSSSEIPAPPQPPVATTSLPRKMPEGGGTPPPRPKLLAEAGAPRPAGTDLQPVPSAKVPAPEKFAPTTWSQACTSSRTGEASIPGPVVTKAAQPQASSPAPSKPQMVAMSQARTGYELRSPPAPPADQPLILTPERTQTRPVSRTASGPGYEMISPPPVLAVSSYGDGATPPNAPAGPTGLTSTGSQVRTGPKKTCAPIAAIMFPSQPPTPGGTTPPSTPGKPAVGANTPTASAGTPGTITFDDDLPPPAGGPANRDVHVVPADLKQRIRKVCGNQARDVDVVIQPDSSLLVQVRGVRAGTDGQLVQQIMTTVPEMSVPGIRLALEVDR
jgi:osmotically-inducible protein OsmY